MMSPLQGWRIIGRGVYNDVAPMALGSEAGCYTEPHDALRAGLQMWVPWQACEREVCPDSQRRRCAIYVEPFTAIRLSPGGAVSSGWRFERLMSPLTGLENHWAWWLQRFRADGAGDPSLRRSEFTAGTTRASSIALTDQISAESWAEWSWISASNPLGVRLRKRTLPWQASMQLRTIARPRPAPPSSRVRAASGR